MPDGLPTAEQLLGKEIGFFSIDTSVIQANGYKFDSAPLSALKLQIPRWISVQLTEIVQREISAHRMKSVKEASQKLTSASKDLARLAALEMGDVNKAFAALNAEHAAEQYFDNQLKQFVGSLRGAILPVDGPRLAKQMFERYFACSPPFEARKKEEFPDAASLLVLEDFARENNTKGILISGDKGGWAAFAKESQYLYCLPALDAFTALFETHGPNAETVLQKVRGELTNSASDLSLLLEESLQNHVAGSFWTVDDLYSNFNVRLEADVWEVTLIEHEVDPDAIRLWIVENDPTSCVVELTATLRVDTSISVEFFQRDWVDGGDFSVGTDDVIRTVELEVEVFLTCRGELLEGVAEDWDVGVDIAGGDYTVDVGEIDPDFSGCD